MGNKSKYKRKEKIQLKLSRIETKIQINDIFHELFDENERLLNELMFANKCLNVLITFKTFVDFISNKIKSNLDSNESKKFEKLSEEVKQVLTQKSNENSFPITEELSQNLLNSENDSQVLGNAFKIFDSTKDFDQRFDDTFDYIMRHYFEDQNIETNLKDIEETEYLSQDSYDSDSDYIPEPKEIIPKEKREKTFNCNSCDEKYKSKSNLNKHMREEHNRGDPYVCKVNGCDFRSFIRNKYQNHMKAHRNGVKPFSCAHVGCDYTTYSKDKMKRHRTTHKIQYECNICHNKYMTEDALKQHIEEHNNNDIKCDFNGCHYRTLNKKEFEIHMNRHKGIKPFQCTYDLCEKSYFDRKNLDIHINRVHKNNEHVCEDCGKRFTQKYWFQFHKVIHLDDSQKPLVCGQPNCQFRTNSESHMKYHRREKHCDPRLACPLNCGKFFRNEQMIASHMVSHSDQRNFVCDVEGCHKTYKTKNSLHMHLLSHKELTRFSCEWPGCEYKSNIRNRLVRHQLIHKKVDTDYKNSVLYKDETPLTCEWPGCQFKSNFKNKMTRHQLVHSNEKNLSCDWPQCGKTFKYKISLDLHMKGHTDDKPQCPWPGCQHRTQYKNNMKIHIKRRHKTVTNYV